MTLSPDTDARAEIQALLDATPYGGTLYLPEGSYFVTRAGSAYHALRVPAGVRVRGNGTTIRQAPGTAESVRVFLLDGGGGSLERLEIDGDADNQTGPTFQRHGAFVTAPDCVFRHVTARNFAGDGLYLHTGSHRALFDACTATGNRRNGVTLGGSSIGVRVYGGTFAGNAAQQVDSEPGVGFVVEDVSITDAVIDCGSSAQFALTVSGSSATSRALRWRVTGCTITGGINIVWADDVLIGTNTITLPGALPVRVYRTSSRITIARNTIAQANAAQGSYPSAIYAVGTGTGQAPDDVQIVGNTLACAAPSALGVRLEGLLTASVIGNAITGGSAAYAGGAGVYGRATNVNTPFALMTVVGNTITGFGARGLSIQGNGSAQMTMLRAVGNTIGDAGTVQSTGMVLDDGTHCLQASDIAGNAYGSGVTAGRL